MEVDNIEFNNVEYEVKSLIEFSSLARLLFDLAKRHKELEKKYEYINDSVQDKDQRISDLELKINGESRSYKKKFDGETISQKSKLFEGNNKTLTSNDNNESKDEGLDSIHGNKVNTDLIAKLNKKVKEIERQLSDMMIPKIKNNEDNIKNNAKHLDNLNKNYEKINRQFMEFKDQLDKMRVKVEDFNIYDVFQGQSGEGGNLDVSKALIMNLENKVFKKFDLYDEKNKKNETDLFKALEDLKSMKGLVDNFKVQNQRSNEKVNEIEAKLNEYINTTDNKLEEITNSLEQLKENMKEGMDTSELNKEIDEKIKKLEDELKELINSSIASVKESQSNASDPMVKKKIQELENNIKELRKNHNELDKNLNSNIKTLNNTLKENVSNIEKELQKKINSNELTPINDKLYSLEEEEKDLNARLDTLYESNDKIKLELVSFNKKMEYILGEFDALKAELEKNKTIKTESENNNFVDLTLFNNLKKEIASKIEKLRAIVEELDRNFNEINSSLAHFPTNKDFVQLQNTLMSMLDEFKISCAKKYMEKSEILKSLKMLEKQIKLLGESYKKVDTGDNWLLAKKPINNYQCASC
jgi:chromosome segregation ATPase